MKIEVDWRRLDHGVFTEEEGDICAAYSSDRRPKIRKPFTHEGKTYTCMGTAGGGPVPYSASCYELVPFTDEKPAKVPYSHEGEEVIWKGKKYRMGPRVEFVATEQTVEEHRAILRLKYERGGAFTSNRTYHDLLAEFSCDERWNATKGEYDKPEGNYAEAIELELAMPNYNKHRTAEPEAPPQPQDDDTKQAMLFAGLLF